jgi:hypothetical protein
MLVVTERRRRTEEQQGGKRESEGKRIEAGVGIEEITPIRVCSMWS